jgi:predicted RNase H-like HicB family nuclease
MKTRNLTIRVQKLRKGGDYRYLGTCSDLPNLLVAGDSRDEVVALAPKVAEALVVSMKAVRDVRPKRARKPPRLASKSTSKNEKAKDQNHL